MKANGPNQQSAVGQDNINDKPGHKFQWKLIHHSLIFWIFALLMLIGIIYFIMSLGFVVIPQHFMGN